jgi:hypothetical protein
LEVKEAPMNFHCPSVFKVLKFLTTPSKSVRKEEQAGHNSMKAKED